MEEIIIAKDNVDGLPHITMNENVFTLGGSSRPYMPDHQFDLFFDQVKKVIEKHSEIILNFQIGYFSTNSQQVLKKLFNIMNNNWFKCHPIVNWHYFANDEDMLEYGQMYKEWNPKIEFIFVEQPEQKKRRN